MMASPATSPSLPTAPPTAPLPALPIYRTRKPLPDLPTSAPAASTASPRPLTRSVTTSGLPTPKPTKTASTPAVPTLNTTASGDSHPTPTGAPASASSAIPPPVKTLRKTASIGQFPLPPNGAKRMSSMPSSPLAPNFVATSDVPLPRKPRPRTSGYGLRSRASNASLRPGASPSLSSSGFDGVAVSRKPSDANLSLLSPSPSVRSSANGSPYHTDGTSFEEDDAAAEAAARGRSKSQDTVTDKTKDGKGNVVVSVRVRPDAAAAGDAHTDGEWMVDGRRSLISFRGREAGDYRYDNVFPPHDNNARVYDHAAKRLVRRVMEGYHGTVFAYGMTGTGKTFSMQGTATSPGVIPLAIYDIFSYIRENPAREFLLRVSYLEIYNERIYDLLSPSAAAAPGQPPQEEIRLREDGKRGVYATPLKEEIVQSPNQLLRVIARGDLARRTSSTQFNARSSRSHAVVQIVVESRERAVPPPSAPKPDRLLPGGVLVSTLSLIDLAGSEKAADNKERRQEGAHINRSLLTLGTVIARLSGDDDRDKDEKRQDGVKSDKDKDTGKHLPYRDSKLTRLLQPALSGDSLVSILCTVQLSSAGTSAATLGQHTGETLGTLKFASRAKNNLVSHAKRNVSNPQGGDAGSRALLDRYRLEIQELRAQLETQNKAKQQAEELDDIEKDRLTEAELERQERTRHEEQMLEMQLARTALKERISHLNRLILSSKSSGVNSASSRLSTLSQVPLRATARDSSVSASLRSRSSVLASDVRMVAARQSSVASETMRPGVDRVESFDSAQPGALRTRHSSPPLDDDTVLAADEEDDADDDGNGALGGLGISEGEASLAQQNRMLQADLADKTRYSATLEKRLLQARRTSHSRVSMQLSARSGGPNGNESAAGAERALVEKDREIEELRARLDDQTRMVNALRSAARKRERLIDTGSAADGDANAGGDRRTSLASQSLVSDDMARVIHDTKRLTNGSVSHGSNPSIASRSSARASAVAAQSLSSRAVRTVSPSSPLSPMALLRSPSGSSGFSEPTTEPFARTATLPRASSSPSIDPSRSAAAVATAPPTTAHRRRSVDEMTQLLDQMIQDKVDSGHVLRSSHGSLRVAAKRESVLEQQRQEQLRQQRQKQMQLRPPASSPPLPPPPPPPKDVLTGNAAAAEAKRQSLPRALDEPGGNALAAVEEMRG